EAAGLDLERQVVDRDDVVEPLRHAVQTDVRRRRGRGLAWCGRRGLRLVHSAHLEILSHASWRTSPSMPAIWSNSSRSATSGGEIWMTGSPRSSARQISPRSKIRGERKPLSRVSHSSSEKVSPVALSFT